jgi:predicted nucleic acid-binding protein
VNVVLDTSAYSHFRNNHHDVVEVLARAEQVYMPAIVVGELEAAFRIGRRTADNRARLDEFLDEDFVHIVPVGREIASRYGEVFAKLRAAGTPIPINDVWIAATALHVAARLITFDRDFARISDLDATVMTI